MRSLPAIVAALIIALAASYWAQMVSDAPAPGSPTEGVPIETLAAGLPRPEIGLTSPLPDWIPLPAGGRAIAGGFYPPQPPYGAAISLTLVIDETAEAFAAAYRDRLERAGFAVRDIPPQFNVAFDEPDLQFEAVERRGGHVVYVALRHTRAARFAQLTFWDLPAPRI